MKYVKHPEHGNKYIDDDAVGAHVADGWVVWPRSAAEKSAPAVVAATIVVATPVVMDTPPKRSPGRPRKGV